jgi:ring-1,2-phenylacetyl-CoA epoxidase subunit PaaE
MDNVMKNTQLFRVKQIDIETPDTKTFHLQSIDNATVNYQSGQFLTLISKTNGHEIRRSYSLSSSPVADDLLSITVKRVANGEISRWLHDHVQMGDILEALLPTGRFVLPKPFEKVKHYFFIVAGSGITPVFSMIKTLIKSGYKGQITLIYQSKNAKNTIFYDKIAGYTDGTSRFFREGGKNLNVQYFFSRPTDGHPPAYLNKDILTGIVEKQFKGANKDATFYVCGSTAFMRMVTMTLQFLDFTDKQILREDFVIPTFQEYVDLKDFGKPARLTIHFQNKTYNIDVPFRKTLLDAALDNQIPLPYSCKGGVCTTCFCKTTKGKVIMPTNDKLFEDEILRGGTLSCIAYADTEVVEIVV